MRANTTTAGGPPPSLRMQASDWLLLGVLALVWGSGFFLTRVAVRDIPPATLITLRAATTAGILYTVIRLRGVPLPELAWRAWRPYVVMGLFNTALPFTLNGWGLTRIESSLAAILTATVPICTVVVAHLVTHDERSSPASAIGVALGLSGVVMIVGGGSLAGSDTLGMAAILLASLCYGYSGVYARSVRSGPLVMVWAQMTTATLFLLPLVIGWERPWQSGGWSMDAVASTVVLTAGTIVAFLLFFHLLSRVGAVNASLVAYLIPPVAIVLGVTFLDEQLLAQHLAGMVVILAAMAVIDGRLARWLTRRRALSPVKP